MQSQEVITGANADSQRNSLQEMEEGRRKEEGGSRLEDSTEVFPSCQPEVGRAVIDVDHCMKSRWIS